MDSVTGSTLKHPFTLYHYWRSTSSWRVRWMLIHKQIPVQYIHVNLLDDETEKPAHLQRNPMGYVPVLEIAGANHSQRFIESVAIGEWLEETYPENPLLPKDPYERAHVRSLCEVINAGIQPLGNLTVTEHLSADPETRKQWIQFWVKRGFNAFEKMIQTTASDFTMGKHLSMADIFLIPMCYAATRNEVDLREFPNIQRVNENALKTAGAIASHPDLFKPA